QRVQLAAPMLFVDSAAKRAVELIPRAQQWKPDIVVHEETELAGALAAARIGARHVIHGLGLASVKLRAILTPRFARLCEEWQVPEVAGGCRPFTFLDICPPSLRTDGAPAGTQVQPLRPAAGEPHRANGWPRRWPPSHARKPFT
ncbi:MAG: hypothetical protein M3300_10105, partial [Actinomycetota bacterium]|nr:hypothetical protein [Actinomycetota bacterium]